jgi:DNA-binding response OmpR family regulator
LPDILVLPAADFLALSRFPARGFGCLAYGPVASMRRAFERGCLDYLREPWSFSELFARLSRFRKCRFRAGGKLFLLEGSALCGEGAPVDLGADELCLLLLLLRNAPFPVSREAAIEKIPSFARDKDQALGRCAVALRRNLEMVSSGFGKELHTVRGHGYRLDAEICG